ncbi:MAG: beta-ketoacyl synthase chain length factor [Chitinophagaceae bacterium]
MLYIHQTSFISPQQTFTSAGIDVLQEAVNNKLQVIEPVYEGIPTGILRRMGKAIRLGVGAALPLIKQQSKPVNGIIIGTANGGMEDCIKFLNQIIDYEEGMLTPTNFVQSTTNAIAAQIGLLSANKSYNTTHVHRAHAFENALLDAAMQLQENSDTAYLVGGIDEISSYNYNIEWLGGWYKKEPIAAKDLYDAGTIGSIAGEGAAMFLVNNNPEAASAKLSAIQMLHTSDAAVVKNQLASFMQKHLPKGGNTLFLSGENGDSRLLHYYTDCEKLMNDKTIVARFKHMTGEYPSVSAAALWLAIHIINKQEVPLHMLKYNSAPEACDSVLIYNNYKGEQHSFILVEKIQ